MVRARVLEGGRAERADARVKAVLEVLGGRATAEVGREYAVDSAVLYRWVRTFVDAGTARVTNRPELGVAQQRDRFLAAFAHEVRSPLTVALGWVGMLMEDDLSPQATTESVHRLHHALGRLRDHALDVELLTAASLGLLQLDCEPVRAAEVVAELPDGTEIRGAGTVVVVDPAMFRRVARDLWRAATRPPAPRSVHVEVGQVAPWVEIRIVRDADPIDPAVLQALFEPFDLNDDGTGVTIGLYLARALAVAHGGTVGVDQTGEGAAFWVRIPDSAQTLLETP